jgi:hypothetical protein
MLLLIQKFVLEYETVFELAQGKRDERVLRNIKSENRAATTIKGGGSQPDLERAGLMVNIVTRELA